MATVKRLSLIVHADEREYSSVIMANISSTQPRVSSSVNGAPSVFDVFEGASAVLYCGRVDVSGGSLVGVAGLDGAACGGNLDFDRIWR